MGVIVSIIRGIIYVPLFALRPLVVFLGYVFGTFFLIGGGLTYALGGPTDGAFITLAVGLALIGVAGIYQPILTALAPQALKAHSVT